MSKSLATWFNPRLGIKSRAKGASAVASSAYRACVSLHDERVGKTHDYTKKRGHVETFTVGPYSDISKLWNAAEKSENRKNSSVMRELIIPLPDEWDKSVFKKDNLEKAIEYAKDNKIETLEIGTGNPGLIQIMLYQKCGFRIVGVELDYFRKNHKEKIYENGIECRDMIRMRMEFGNGIL